MKKLLSVLLASAMILSLVFVCMITASASVEGDWDVYANKGTYRAENEQDKKPVPGYEYTEDGLHMIPADWSDTSPWGIFQTKEQVDLRQGVYMEVRIDNFTYDGDKWFGFNIWEEKIDEFPHETDKSSIGLEALVRINGNKEITSIPVNSHVEYGTATATTYMNTAGVKNNFDSEGRPIITFQITWSEAEGYNVIINGATLTKSDAKTMTDLFDGPDNDGHAYISFSLQNSIKGGTVECTILKFGTSPTDCDTPTGDDSAEPINNKIVIADIADPNTVPEGDPAIFINGSKEASDISGKPGSTNNSIISINDDNTINVKTTSGWASVSISVDNEVSYDVDDFPIMLIITKNFCTCAWQDGFPSCTCAEMPTVITMAGDTIAADSANTIKAISYLWEPIYDEEGNMYSYFVGDWTEYSGRINGLRFDIYGVKFGEVGRDNFDIMNVTFFRSIEEADAYFNDYLIEIGVIEGEVTTEPPVSEETDSEEASETDDESESEEDSKQNDNETGSAAQPVESTEGSDSNQESEPVESESKVESDKTPSATKQSAKSGCGGTVGLGSMAIISVFTALIVTFKKKREE